MASVDDITKDTEAKLKISETSTPQDGSQQASPEAPAGPVRPPELAMAAGKTTAEILAELNKSPLFMTELEDNDDVAALQALAYEGTALENAADFKERGNESFRERRWRDARESYDRGVAILAAEERRRARGVPPADDKESDDPAEVRRQRGVLEALYANRAACHLELRNLRACTLDGAAALRLNPRNVKALYRSARALLALGRVAEADDACARGLEIDPDSAGLRALADDIIRRAGELDAKQRAAEERAARDRRRALLLRAALRARGIRTRATARPPEMEDAVVRLEPDPDAATSALSFPAVLLYPAHLQSDLVKGFGETQTLAEHLAYVLPPPWDAAGEYAPAAVVAYMETAAGGLVRVGKKLPLLRLLAGGNVEVVDGLVRFYILPAAKAEAWVQEFKTKRAAEKTG